MVYTEYDPVRSVVVLGTAKLQLIISKINYSLFDADADPIIFTTYSLTLSIVLRRYRLIVSRIS